MRRVAGLVSRDPVPPSSRRTVHMSVPRLRSAFVLCFLAFSVQPVHATSEFYGYRIPDHHWSAWSGNLSFSGNRLKSDQTPDFSGTDGRLDFNAATSLVWGRDSDREQHALSLRPSVAGARRGSERRVGSPLVEESTSRQNQMAEGVEVFGSATQYPWTLPLGFSGSALVRGQFGQTWDSQGASRPAPPQELRLVADANGSTREYLTSVAFGPILGRVRNATPVLDAAILEERLTRTGA